ncbi:MAG: AmmeMemoRadiSam system protein B [Spirochaetota bacterium]|nr:MAG: AmmeMemoRadiSam system protein B [Spirochaetota bacterium]
MGFRKPDLAGAWYPGVEKEIRKTIEGYIGKIEVPDEKYSGKGGIVPHAGWYFSGKVAFWVLYSISKVNNPELIFVFGMHLPPHGPDYIFIDDGYETPIGRIPVNQEAANLLYDSYDFIKEDAVHYSQDNTVEIQLPFIKHLFPEASIVTVGVSPTERATAIGEKAEEISKKLGLNSCYIGSTDLTHYGPNYAFAPQGTGPESVSWVRDKNDKMIVESFLNADADKVISQALSSKNACCPGAATAAIAASKKAGCERGILVTYTTSYDVHPDSSFVGYAGVVY